ncbi:hypothetical protein UFOVP331_42 [uncultured Caudovirales phage]|uniref:Uncharacterized protein n=1 Tax=uncultured Caudovirales phage TaxID=2100421 RepID=A0A6J5LVD0_9CAUD|nr:hypothetical protein UFOVP331_42 [uncultured Caudovirales phage]
MAKIILEFDSVEELQGARTALDAMNWKSSMWDLDQKLRNTTKHGMSVLALNKEASDIEVEVAEKYREVIREILERYSLYLDF